MGWENYHLHQFIVGGAYFGEPDPDFDAEDDRKVNLGQIVQGRNRSSPMNMTSVTVGYTRF